MIETARIQREIDLAWKTHDPERDRIPAEVSRRVRAFKRELAPRTAAITQTLDGPIWRTLAADVLHKRGKGRERALVKIRKVFAGANVVLGDHTLAISWLSPSTPVLMATAKNPGFAQDSVIASLALAWMSSRHYVTLWAQWVLEVPDHALGRLLQRNPQADLAECLVELAAAFLDADAAAVHHAAEQRRPVYLRVGGGAFVVEPIYSSRDDDDELVLFARARTYLTDAMLGTSQVPVEVAANLETSVLDLLLQVATATWDPMVFGPKNRRAPA